MKHCFNCRRELLETKGIQCEKCQKNEAKYGAPERCKYCLLPAAYVERKCVHCTHMERKMGAPIPCIKCGSKRAFAKDKRSEKTAICRLCSMSITPEEKSKLKRSAAHPSTSHHSELKLKTPKIATDTQRNDVKLPSVSALDADHLNQIQQLRDQIATLRSTIVQRDQSIMEKDKIIGSLKSDIMMKDREHRSALQQINKRHESAITALRDQLKELKRQLSVAPNPSRHR